MREYTVPLSLEFSEDLEQDKLKPRNIKKRFCGLAFSKMILKETIRRENITPPLFGETLIVKPNPIILKTKIENKSTEYIKNLFIRVLESPTTIQEYIYANRNKQKILKIGDSLHNMSSIIASNLNFLPSKETPNKSIQQLPSIDPETLKRRERSTKKRVPSLQEIKTPSLSKDRALLIKNAGDLKKIRAGSYLVMEAETSQVILSHKPHWRLEMASITKVMTCYVVLELSREYDLPLSTTTTAISSTATEIGGTSAELLAGEVYSLEQLMYGLMLPSGNDAAIALAEYFNHLLNGGDNGGDLFLRYMNTYAQKMHLRNTCFGNVHGLPSEGKSTAFDIAKLCCVCLRNEVFRKIVSMEKYTCKVESNKKIRWVTWKNTNKLLGRENFIGVKTGITVTAGPCLASAYLFRDKTYVVVLLRTNKISRRFKETRKIIQWTMRKLYKNTITIEESEVLSRLGRSETENSEDEDEFIYDTNSYEEINKRTHILAYET